MNLRRQPVQRQAVEFQLDGALTADAKARRWREEDAGAICLSNEQLDRDGPRGDEDRLF